MAGKFDELVSIWSEAENESLAAEAILNQVQDGEFQAALHILRSWKLLALLNAKERDENFQIERIDTIESLIGVLNPENLVVLPEKRKQPWEKSLRAFFSLDPGRIPASADALSTTLKDLNVLDASDDLNDALRASWKNLKKRYGKTFLQKLHLTGRQAAMIVVGILLLAYIIPSLYIGFWNPAMWFKPRHGQFVLMHAEQEWGVLGINKSVEGRPLGIGKVRYATGLGTHAASRIRLAFPSRYSTFTGACGVDDEMRSGGSITCRIVSDGKVLFESPVLRGGMPAQKFSVDVSGRGSVELLIGNGGDDRHADHADWVDLELK